VSDRTTVLSKASIPLVVQPLIGFMIATATQLVILYYSTVVLMFSGVNPAVLWSRLSFFQIPMVMLYGLIAHLLWYAPIYTWLLLVSAWARRIAFLWAVLPVLGLLVLERLALGTKLVPALLQYRVMGAMAEAFSVDAMKGPVIRLSQLTPGRFLSTPGLWAGLLFAAACLTAAVRLRRTREPI
jgi:ABC-2 type transport system permease protein